MTVPLRLFRFTAKLHKPIHINIKTQSYPNKTKKYQIGPKKIQDIKNSIITTDAHFDKKTIAKFTSKTNPPKQQQKRQTSITNRRRLNNSYARETETGEFI